MFLSVRVFESVCAKDYFVAVFDNGFASDEDVEPALKGIMDSQLMTVQLKFTVMAIVDKNSRFGNTCLDDTVLEVLQK